LVGTVHGYAYVTITCKNPQPSPCLCSLSIFCHLTLAASSIPYDVQNPYPYLYPRNCTSSCCTKCSSQFSASFLSARTWFHLPCRRELQGSRARWWRRRFYQWKALDCVLRHRHDGKQEDYWIFFKLCGFCRANNLLQVTTVVDGFPYSLIAKVRQS
jgi:hypothetical protein